jgi:hypothetical protein
MYESKGMNSSVQISLPFQPKKVVESNFLEDDGNIIKQDSNVLKFDIGKNKTRVLKIYY